MVEEKTVLETYEEKRELVKEFNLTSDLFAGKVFEDLKACQELCRIFLRDQSIILQSVRTQYVIRNLETHSMELDILMERVRHFKVHKKGVNVMCEIADRIRNEGREEGKSVGRLESKIEDILELLEEFGKVPQRIVDLIRAEDNLGVLSRWHKSAARATSITEFESNM